MKLGLKEKEFNKLIEILGQFPEMEQAIIYISGARGNFKTASGTDIALKGTNINWKTLCKLHKLLDDSFYHILNTLL